MRQLALATLLLSPGLLLATGCTSGAGPALPDTSTPDLTLSMAEATEVLSRRSGENLLAAEYLVTIDRGKLHGSVEQLSARSAQAQPPQALTYDLDIDRFLTKEGFRIAGLEANADGDLTLTFTHAHPFPAPNFSAAITASNRADLGYTGRLVIYAESATESFFGSTVNVDPHFVLDPDGYLQPRTLLAHPTTLNDTFPYVLLADEAQNNRLGVSNGGNPRGNYDPAQAGWSMANAGPEGTGWTGFDFVHGGQKITNSFTLSAEAMGTTSTATFRVGVLIKYTDPRGIGGKTRRFPTDPPVATEFAYRLPFAALDAAVIDRPVDLRISAEAGVGTPIELTVRDWDVRANPAASLNLSGETDVTLVPPGTQGGGVMRLDVAGLFSTPFLIPAGTGAGIPGDLLRYTGTLQPDLAPPSGPALAAVELVDPEDAGFDSFYHYGVDPYTLVADIGRALDIRTYQVFPVTIFREPPQIVDVVMSGDMARENATVTATVTGSPVEEWEWDFGGGVYPNEQTGPSPLSIILGGTGDYTGTLTVRNADGEDSFDFDFSTVAKAIGMDVIVVRSGTSYPELWPGMPTWNEADVEAYMIPHFNAIYATAGVYLDPALVTVTAIDNPQIFNIDSEADFNMMWDVLLNHSKPWPQFMVINADNWAGFGGIMSDQTCNWDNAGRGCVVTSGWDAAFTPYLIGHELGHVFALPHIRTASPLTPANYNLMSYGTTDTSLFEDANREAGASCNTWPEREHNQPWVVHKWVVDYLP